MPDHKVIVMVARQRSGTTALAETLVKGGTVQSFGEVFHDLDERMDGSSPADLRLVPEANFFSFLTDLLRRQPELAYPSVDNRKRLFDHFLAHLRTLTDRSWILIDIKYNSWHHFEHVYSVPGSAPFLLHLLKQVNAAFIHVTRTGCFARYCSEQFALARNKWHAEQGTESENGSIIIDPSSALRDMLESRRQIEVYSRFLGGCARRIDLQYEKIFADDRLTPATDAKVKRLLDGDWTPEVVVPLRKITPPLRSVVSNREEVLAYFETTTFRDEVSKALDAT